MADTAHSQVSAATVIDGIPIVRWGLVAAGTETPADWAYWSANITSTALASGTAICLNTKPCLIEFKPRVSTAMARKDCDDVYGTSDLVPHVLGGRRGYITTVAKIEDPSAAIYPGHAWMAGSTAGDIELMELTQLSPVVTGSGTAVRSFIINGFNTEELESGDTYMKFCWI